MPKVGVHESITFWMTGTAYLPVAAGSPGPFDRKTPSGFIARMSSAEVVAGTTVTLQPSPANPVAPLPRRLVPGKALARGDQRHEVHALKPGPFARLFL